MLKVTLKVRKLEKTGWYCNKSQICSKTIKTKTFGKRAFGKRKNIAKINVIKVKKKGWGGERNYISEKLILTQCLLLYPICNIQFNLWKPHFRVTGIKVIITKVGYSK